MARSNEPLEVLVDGSQSQDSEDIGEQQVDREVGAGIADKVKPVIPSRTR